MATPTSTAGEAPADAIPWQHCFTMTPVPWDPTEPPQGILVEQVSAELFRLHCRVHYSGPLPEGIPEALREIDPALLARTDLTSVPPVLRWFLSRYGPHTPAALIHDRLTDPVDDIGISRLDADRYFLRMLAALEVPPLRRTLMWSAVVFGSRWKAGGGSRVAIGAWALASVAGIGGSVWAVAAGSPALLAVTVVAPIPFALCWGKQYVAGLVGGYSAPWLVPTTLVGALGYGVYDVLERGIGVVVKLRGGAPAHPTPPAQF